MVPCVGWRYTMDTGNIDETYATDQEGRTALLVQSKAQFLAFLARHLGNRAEAEDLLRPPTSKRSR